MRLIRERREGRLSTCTLEPAPAPGASPAATAARASRLGATIRVPEHEVPGVGRAPGLASPQGVPFHVVQPAR